MSVNARDFASEQRAEMGNDGGSIPTRRELVKEAARNPTATVLKEKLREHLAHRWSQCPVSHTALARPVVSDYAGDLYNKDAIIQFLLPAEVSPVDKAEYDKFIQGRITSLRDVVEVIFETEHDDVAKTDRWICPITSKVLGPSVRAVYIVPCGHAFSHEAIKEMKTEQCSQCGAAYQSRDIIPILPSTDAEKEQVQERIATKPSSVIKNAATASLTARVLEEQDAKKKRRLENENIGSLYSKKTDDDKKGRDADFMSRGYSLASKANPSVASSLRSRALSSSTQARQDDRARNRNRNLPFTEKLRRKIWGTDNPPGLADPYGGPSFLERHWAQREQRYKEKEDALAQREAAEAAERERRQAEFREAERPDVYAANEADVDADIDEYAEYKPATTWDGLMHIGHAGHWQDIPPTQHDTYQPWFDSHEARSVTDVRATTPEDVELLFRDAADQAGVELSATAGGQGESDSLSSQPLDLTNPATFQILKSFRGLTGFTFADHFLSSLARPRTGPAATYGDLVTHYLDVITKPPPTSVYDSLAASADLAAQPNVLIFPRRETPVDKEKEVGRWKVIEKELTERGLPVLGRLDASSSSS
ncbi:hypothetical protein DV735_g3430, partial [Chaetothyriales sp. CBS 134920]